MNIKLIYKAIRLCDIFGIPLTLRVNQRSLYKTHLGGFLSIVIILLVFLFFLQNLFTLFQKKNLTSKQLYTFNDAQETTINFQDFMLAIAIQSDSSIVNDQFQITLEQRINTQVNTATTKKTTQSIQLVPCTLYHFQNIFKKYNQNIETSFNRLNLNQFLCPSLDAILKIQGTQISNIFQFIKISVSRLQTNFKEYSEEEQFNIQIYLVNKIINPDQVDDKYIHIYLDDSLSFPFQPRQIQRFVDVYLKQYQFQNDQSLTPFKDISYSQTLTFEEMRNTIQIGREPSAVFYLRKHLTDTIIQRNYEKIDEVLSRLGGFLQIFLIFLGILVREYNKFAAMIEIANKVYEFSEDPHNAQHHLDLVDQLLTNREQEQINSEIEDKQVLPQSKINLIKQNSFQQQQQLQNSPLKVDSGLNIQNKEYTQQTAQQFLQCELLLANEKKSAIRLNCKNGLDYFQKSVNLIINRTKPIAMSFELLINKLSLRILLKQRVKVKLMNKAIEQIHEQLDVYHILTKLNEVDKLKDVLLQNSQFLLFNFTPKPRISILNDEIWFDRGFMERRARNFCKSMTFDKENNCLSIDTQKHCLQRENAIYSRIYKAYDTLLYQKQEKEYQSYLNHQIIRKLGPELQKIFKLSKIIDFQQLGTRTKQEQSGIFQRRYIINIICTIILICRTSVRPFQILLHRSLAILIFLSYCLIKIRMKTLFQVSLILIHSFQ